MLVSFLGTSELAESPSGGLSGSSMDPAEWALWQKEVRDHDVPASYSTDWSVPTWPSHQATEFRWESCEISLVPDSIQNELDATRYCTKGQHGSRASLAVFVGGAGKRVGPPVG